MHHAEYKLWFVCVLVQERVKQDVGPFPKEEDRILSWCRRLEKREQGVLLWGIGMGEKKTLAFLVFHLHADDTRYHYIEGRCSYWHVNQVSCVLCLCDQVNLASVVALLLHGSRKNKFTWEAVVCVLSLVVWLHCIWLACSKWFLNCWVLNTKMKILRGLVTDICISLYLPSIYK